MAGSLSGVGQQQVPLSQPYQPGGSDQNRAIRQQEQEPRKEDIQVRGAPAAEAQKSEKTTESRKSISDSASNGNSMDASSQRRGSVVNLLV